MAARPLVSIFSLTGEKSGETALPNVMTAPIRPDIVQFVHTNMAKNSRQAYAVSIRAGKQVSASSWGTGRAVARIPRVGGGGTSRSGQGAFGNMCRGGRMFAPTKTWRKWHRKINVTQKRYAVSSALAATAVPALVMARGHRVDEVPEIPLVLDNAIESSKKTSAAKDILAAVGALEDVEKAGDSKKIRAGKGKMRGRRYTLRRGPLIVYASNDGVEQAFRNLPGVELCCVSRLNLLQLAPGGHMGRLCVWSQAAFDSLDTIYGDDGKNIPQPAMINADLARIINSDEVQSVVNPAKRSEKKPLRKKNPMKSLKALEKIDPYAAAARRSETAAMEARAGKKAETLAKKRAANKAKKAFKASGKAFYEAAVKQGDVCADGFGL
uniref:Large ribosomal subunit protein uL4 C-terminal domain-containing protein n=1 Tax=Ditylum brightwellii TaxID=49249 RepID=A0A6U3NQW2_9STRA|mmetsp:Transcript_111/g.182  ORF Transcript_111/g.182 Transcript_111/m.182 type:complete len:382 (-) Transcript_111:176-1321(-)